MKTRVYSGDYKSRLLKILEDARVEEVEDCVTSIFDLERCEKCREYYRAEDIKQVLLDQLTEIKICEGCL